MIGVIDDGINPDRFKLGSLVHDVEVTPELELKNRVGYDVLERSHGSTCAAIIRKYAPEAVFASIKVLNDESRRGLQAQLLKALEWCMEHRLRLLNLSLGSIDFRDYEPIRAAVNAAYRQGLIMVAACHNRDIFTCPASLSNVIGVKCAKGGDMALAECEYIFHDYPPDGVEITASGAHYLTSFDGYGKETSPSNSFAAPAVTALVYGMLRRRPGMTLEEIKVELRRGAKRESAPDLSSANGGTSSKWFPYLRRTPDWVERALVLHQGNGTIGKVSWAFPVIGEMILTGDGITDTGEVRRFLATHPETETVVMVEDGSVGSGGEMWDVIGDSGKNVIFTGAGDREGEVKHWRRIIAGKGGKVWYPSGIKHFYRDQSRTKELDVPLVVVYDYTGDKGITLTSGLKELFRRDGYHAVGMTGSGEGIVRGLEYVPVARGTAPGVKILAGVYDADIFLLGLDMVSRSDKECARLEKFLKPDLRVIVTGQVTEEMERRLGGIWCGDEEQETVMLYREGKIKQREYCTGVVMEGEIDVGRVYECLRGLLGEGEEREEYLYD